MKKIIIIIASIVITCSIYANDSEDISYINKLYLNKYYKESILELEIFLKKYPNSKFYNSAQNLLAYNYYLLEKYKDAQKMYERLRTTELRDEANYYLTLIAEKQGDIQTVESNIKDINVKSEMGQRMSIFAGKYYEEKKENEKAEECYRKLITFENSFKSEAMMSLGMLYYNNSEYIRSITIFEEYLLREKKDRENRAAVIYMLAYSNNKIGESSNAIKNYEKIVTEYKDSSYYYKSIYNLMVIYYNQKNNEKALVYSTMLSGSDYEELAFEFSGKISYENGDYVKSEEIFKGLWDKYGNKEMFFKYILSLLKQDKTESALKELNNYNIKDETDSSLITEYYYYSMFILFTQKKYDSVLKKMNELSVEKIEKSYIEDIYGFAADAAFISGDYKESIKFYKQQALINENEKNIQRVVISAYKEKEYELLDEWFKKYSENYGVKGNLSRDVYLSYGNSMAERKRPNEAEKVYSEYLMTKSDSALQINQVTILIDMKEYEKANQILSKLDDSDDNNYLKALAYSGMGKTKESDEILEKLTTKTGYVSNQAFEKLIESTFARERYEDTVKYCDMYLTKRKDVNKEPIIDIKAKSYLKLKKYSEALKIYEDIIKSGKNQDYGYFMSGEINYNAKKYDDAKKNYQAVMEKFKESKYKRVSFYWIINIDYITGKSDAVLKQGEAFIKQYSKGEFVEEVLTIMANIYSEKEMDEKAIAQYEKIYNLQEKDESKDIIAVNILQIYLNNKKYSEMNMWSEKLNNLKDKKIWEALIYENTGKIEEALKIYKELLSDEDIGDRANYLIGTLYFKQEKYSEARNYLESVMNFNNSEYKDDAVLKIGFTYEEEKNYQRALSSFMRIKLLYSDSPLIELAELKIAENYEALGENDQAEKIYDEFVSKYKSSDYYKIVLEKGLIIKLNKKSMKDALELYKELKKVDEKTAKKYEVYFKN